jgi:hypothetical protein
MINKKQKLKFLSWLYNTNIYRFFTVYVYTFFAMIWIPIRFNFDMDKIDVYLIEKKKEATYRLNKAKEENIRITQELDELKKRNNEKEKHIKQAALEIKKRLINHVESLKETNKP